MGDKAGGKAVGRVGKGWEVSAAWVVGVLGGANTLNELRCVAYVLLPQGGGRDGFLKMYNIPFFVF